MLRIELHNQKPHPHGVSYTTSNPLQLISLDRNGQLLNRAALATLRGYFSSQSSVELHGCSVGQGSGGRALVQSLHLLWGDRQCRNRGTTVRHSVLRRTGDNSQVAEDHCCDISEVLQSLRIDLHDQKRHVIVLLGAGKAVRHAESGKQR